MTPLKAPVCYSLSLAIILLIYLTGINNFQIFALPQDANVKVNDSKLNLLVSDTNGT